MVFVHPAARQEFNLCKPWSAVEWRQRRQSCLPGPEEPKCVHGVHGDATAPGLALVVPDTARNWELLSSSRRMGRRGREGKAAP